MSGSQSTRIYKDYWENRLVEIYDTGDFRSLYFSSRYLQSRMSLSMPHHLVLRYTQDMMSALLLVAPPRRVLLIGLGAGSLVRFLHYHFPECAIDAVDHSPPIIKLAQGYFRLPAAPMITLHCLDGLQFLEQRGTTERYDLILLDAFDERGMSAQLYCERFFRLCVEALRPEGVLSCNLWSGEPGRIAKITADLSRVFTTILTLQVAKRGNVIRHATNDADPWPKILRSSREYDRLRDRFGLDLKQMAATIRRTNMSFLQRLRYLFR